MESPDVMQLLHHLVIGELAPKRFEDRLTLPLIYRGHAITSQAYSSGGATISIG
jgi:hypothetical protein